MKLIISEEQEKHLAKNILLIENRFGTAKKRVAAVIEQYFNKAPWLYETYLSQTNPRGLDGLTYKRDAFLNDFYHDSNRKESSAARLAPLFARLAFEAGYGTVVADETKINKLRMILKYVYENAERIVLNKAFPEESLYTMTYDELNRTYGEAVDRQEAEEMERLKNTKFAGESDYEILRDVDYKTAHEIGNYSSDKGRGALCYTQSDGTWKSYKSNDVNKVYILLKPGWKEMKPIHDNGSTGPDGDAYDAYGLSMIYIFVGPPEVEGGVGTLAYCNVRWNHLATYEKAEVDHALTKEQISRLVQANFDSVFTPYTTEELIAKGYEPIDEEKIINAIKDGTKDTHRVGGSDLYTVSARNHKENIYDSRTDTFVLKMWVYNINSASLGESGQKYIYIVTDSNKRNLVDTKGNLLFGNPIDPDAWPIHIQTPYGSSTSNLIQVIYKLGDHVKFNVFNLGTNSFLFSQKNGMLLPDEVAIKNNGYVTYILKTEDGMKLGAVDINGEEVEVDTDFIMDNSKEIGRDGNLIAVRYAGVSNIFDNSEGRFYFDTWVNNISLFEKSDLGETCYVITEAVGDRNRHNLGFVDGRTLFPMDDKSVWADGYGRLYGRNVIAFYFRDGAEEGYWSHENGFKMLRDIADDVEELKHYYHDAFVYEQTPNLLILTEGDNSYKIFNKTTKTTFERGRWFDIVRPFKHNENYLWVADCDNYGHFIDNDMNSVFGSYVWVDDTRTLQGFTHAVNDSPENDLHILVDYNFKPLFGKVDNQRTWSTTFKKYNDYTVVIEVDSKFNVIYGGGRKLLFGDVDNIDNWATSVSLFNGAQEVSATFENGQHKVYNLSSGSQYDVNKESLTNRFNVLKTLNDGRFSIISLKNDPKAVNIYDAENNRMALDTFFTKAFLKFAGNGVIVLLFEGEEGDSFYSMYNLNTNKLYDTQGIKKFKRIVGGNNCLIVFIKENRYTFFNVIDFRRGPEFFLDYPLVINGQSAYYKSKNELGFNLWRNSTKYKYIFSLTEGIKELNGSTPQNTDDNEPEPLFEGKKLIISKDQENYLIDKLNEEVYQMPVPKKANKPYCINPEKVLIVKKFLDNTFTKHDYEKIGPNGLPTIIKIVSMNASNGEPLKYMYQDQLLDLLIDKFQKMFSDVDERQSFLQQVMNDWFGDKISAYGGLSVNSLNEITSKEVTDEANNANVEPTEPQFEAGNYKKGHISIKGMKIAIENPKGSKRSYVDKDGKRKYNVMKNHYGYFNVTKGKDGDAVDVFLGPNVEDFETVYCIDQKNFHGDFDETKVMLGFKSKEAAKKAYLRNYSPDWRGFMYITAVSIPVFKKWLYRGRKQRIPFAKYVEIKKNKIREINKAVK